MFTVGQGIPSFITDATRLNIGNLGQKAQLTFSQQCPNPRQQCRKNRGKKAGSENGSTHLTVKKSTRYVTRNGKCCVYNICSATRTCGQKSTTKRLTTYFFATGCEIAFLGVNNFSHQKKGIWLSLNGLGSLGCAI
jgi:hypothetical protein